jgi:hypothetical protein
MRAVEQLLTGHRIADFVIERDSEPDSDLPQPCSSKRRVRWIAGLLRRRMRRDAQAAVGTWFTALLPQYAQEFSTFFHRHQFT